MRGIVFSTLLMILASALSFHIGRGYGASETEREMKCDCAEQVSSVSDVSVEVTPEMQVAIEACAAAGGKDVGVNLAGLICMIKYDSSKGATSLMNNLGTEENVLDEQVDACRDLQGRPWAVTGDRQILLCHMGATMSSQRLKMNAKECQNRGGKLAGGFNGMSVICDMSGVSGS